MLELLGAVRAGGKYNAPTWRVRCHCGLEYLRSGSRGAVQRSQCIPCGRRASGKGQIYPNAQARKRAQNQRAYQRRKLRQAA